MIADADLIAMPRSEVAKLPFADQNRRRFALETIRLAGEIREFIDLSMQDVTPETPAEVVDRMAVIRSAADRLAADRKTYHGFSREMIAFIVKNDIHAARALGL